MPRFGFIDSDSHVIEPDDLFDKYLEAKYQDQKPLARVEYQTGETGFGFFNNLTIDGHDLPVGSHGRNVVVPNLEASYGDYARAGFSASCYLDAMDRTGIDYMVLYPSTGLYTNQGPTTKADVAAAYNRAYNNWLHDFVSEGQGRLIGAAMIDLRDPDAAAEEAVRAVKDLGLKAVTINPAPVGQYRIFSPEMDRLWATVSDLNVPVGVHVGALSPADTLQWDYFPGLITAQAVSAFAIGNMLACASFIMGGVLQRHPNLRVVHLESGSGWAAYWLHRQMAGPQGGMKEQGVYGLSMAPIDYWRRQCYISTEPDDPAMKYVVDAIGDENIVLATDFAHPEGRYYARTHEEIGKLDGVPGEAKRKIMWDNALRLYPIDA